MQADPKLSLQTEADKRMASELSKEESGNSSNPDTDCALAKAEEAIQNDDTRVLSIWTSAPTKLLLTLYNDLRPKVGKSQKLRNKKRMWEAIKDVMLEHKYNFSSLQIENRWKTLKRGFKRKREKNNLTNRSRAPCDYEQELTECLADKSCVFPEFLWDCKDKDSSKQHLVESSGISLTAASSSVDAEDIAPAYASTSTENVASLSSCTNDVVATSCKATMNGPSLAFQLQEMRKFREKQHQESILLKRAKLQAYERRTNELKRKNDLLERLLEKNANSDLLRFI